MEKLIVKVPDKDSPGYLRRLYNASQFQVKIKTDGITPELVESIAGFLADYVEGDREESIKLLWDCSENQFMELMNAVSGGGVKEVPPQ